MEIYRNENRQENNQNKNQQNQQNKNQNKNQQNNQNKNKNQQNCVIFSYFHCLFLALLKFSMGNE